MPVHVGFAEVDITPPLGIRKIGWLKEIIADSIADPLFARAAVIDDGSQKIAFIQLDTLVVTRTQTADLRRRIEAQYAFPGASIMLAATHNHAGPAVADSGDTRRDDAYIAAMNDKIVAIFGQALSNMQEAEIGSASVFEWEVAHNRRIIMRDGTVQTHGSFGDSSALCFEGPIDPEVAVVAARGRSGQLLGALVNFACHPTHHGGDTVISAGYPGVLARELKSRGCPCTLFLNGASGNTHTADPRHPGGGMSMEDAGRALADGVTRALGAMTFRDRVSVAARSRALQLPFRQVTDAQVHGAAKGAQRFIDPAIYDRGMAGLLQYIEQTGSEPAEVQALFIDDRAFVGVPAEYFVQLGLRVKEETYPVRALMVSCANGNVGYVPHADAFLRGGYETTFGWGSRLAPDAGDLLADAAIALIREGRPA